MHTQMMSCELTSHALEQVVERILNTRQITRADQHILLHMHHLTSQEQALINQISNRLRMGLLKVVD